MLPTLRMSEAAQPSAAVVAAMQRLLAWHRGHGRELGENSVHWTKLRASGTAVLALEMDQVSLV